eukprot:5638321-Karenia_brevis.AAC.1
MAWCSRMQWFYDMWYSQPLHAYIFTQADYALYQEPQAFADLARSPLAQTGALQKRVQQIRAILPTTLVALTSSSSSSSSARPPAVIPEISDEVGLGLLAEDSD